MLVILSPLTIHFDFFDFECKQHRRTALKAFLNGTKTVTLTVHEQEALFIHISICYQGFKSEVLGQGYRMSSILDKPGH